MLTVQIPYRRADGPPNLLVDSTGIRFLWDGGWQAWKHGIQGRRQWREVHLAMDTARSDIRAVKFTPSSDGDSPVLPELRDQISEGEETGKMTADCACGARRCHAAIIARVPKDDGRPFPLIVGGFGQQSEATVPHVFERGSQDADRTTVDAPDTRRSTVEVCAGNVQGGDRRLAWAGERNGRGLIREGAVGRSDPAASGRAVRRQPRVALVPGGAVSTGREAPRAHWSLVEQDLRRPGVTRALLWAKNCAARPIGFGYYWFCEHYEAWKGRVWPTIRQTPVEGEKVFVDFAGDMIDVIDPQTGEARPMRLFVAAMGASNCTCAEAVASEGLGDWIRAQVRMFAFQGGLPKVMVPHNLKSAVSDADRFDPGPNRTYLQARMEPQAPCMLLIIHCPAGDCEAICRQGGATPEGKKEILGLQAGTRESTQSWRELLIDIKARGLAVAPEIAVGDGALGLWQALVQIYPDTCHRRCGVHQIGKVLNAVPASMTPAVISDLHDISHAETRADAQAAMDVFLEKYATKYPKAANCLTKDRDARVAFYDHPARHWDHLRSSNLIESVFATVRLRTVRTKGALSQKTAWLMVFTLIQAAAKSWCRLSERNQLPKTIEGIKFQNGVEVTDATETSAA